MKNQMSFGKMCACVRAGRCCVLQEKILDVEEQLLQRKIFQNGWNVNRLQIPRKNKSPKIEKEETIPIRRLASLKTTHWASRRRVIAINSLHGEVTQVSAR